MRKLRELAQGVFHFLRKHRMVSVLLLVGLVVIVPVAFSFAQAESSASLGDQMYEHPVNTLILLLAAVMNAITAGIGKFCLLLINLIIVPILGYNNFSDSNIIGLGWSLVRDVVNMFVVVILLVIAIMTIIGAPKANWTQQLPRLFIAVVLVNFSRTICGFLIDISQVIMFTFVNAILDIAAGNFAQMLGLVDFGELDSEFIAKVNDKSEGLDGMAYLVGSVIQLALYLSIFGVMVLLAIAFIWRIVILWVLVIMSPIAFLMVGVKDLFGKAGSTYGEWWGKFTAALTMGPTLAFFLWLALAAASGSNLAVKENFPMPEDPASFLPLKQTSLDSMTGLLLALVLLIAGVQQASGAAGQLGGLAAGVMKQDIAEKLVKGSLKYSAKGSTWAFNRGGGALANKLGMTNQKTVTGALQRGGLNLAKSTGNELVQMGAGIASSVPLVGGALGGSLAAAGSKMNKSAGKVLDEEKKVAQENIKGFSGDRKKAVLASLAGDGRLFNNLSEDEQKEFKLGIATDKKMQKQAEEVMGTNYRAKLKESIAFADANKDDLDDAAKERLNATKTANLDLLGSKDDMSKHVNEMWQDGKLNSQNAARLIKDDVWKGQDEGAKNARAALGELKYREDKDGNQISIVDDVKAGRIGADRKKALDEGEGVRPVIGPLPTASTGAYTFALPAAGDPDEDVSRARVIQNVNNVIQSGEIKNMDSDTATAFKEALKNLPPGSISVNATTNAHLQLLDSGRATASEVTGPIGTGIGDARNVQVKMEQVIKQDITSVRHFTQDSGKEGAAKSVAIMNSVSKDDIKQLGGKLMTATGEELKKIQAAMAEIDKTIKKFEGRPDDNGKKAKEMRQSYDAVTRYARPTGPTTP